ncbi:MAG: Crp/Fnr family transcriptional regulator [Planctomycetes bacterium]|nr:Crp/Fnr family transcriptional regulator [Planctomycetota bacterium]
MYKADNISLYAHLKNVPLFNSLTNEQLKILFEAGITKNFPKERIIVYQHDPGDTFYIVVTGKVKITLLNEDGKEIVLSLLKEGDFFGEMSLLDNETRSASAVAIENTTLFLLTRIQFHKLIATYSDILTKIFKEICARLRHANEKIESLAFLDVYGRTIRLLQQLAHDQGEKTKNGIEISHAPTHKEIASMVGASRETITRIIKVLKENHTLVSYKGRKVILREHTNKLFI